MANATLAADHVANGEFGSRVMGNANRRGEAARSAREEVEGNDGQNHDVALLLNMSRAHTTQCSDNVGQESEWSRRPSSHEMTLVVCTSASLGLSSQLRTLSTSDQYNSRFIYTVCVLTT